MLAYSRLKILTIVITDVTNNMKKKSLAHTQNAEALMGTHIYTVYFLLNEPLDLLSYITDHKNFPLRL